MIGFHFEKWITYFDPILIIPGLILSGMVHITDQLWNSIVPKLKNARILVMGSGYLQQ